ncbi:hypothetical protein L0Y41_01610, partial [bacterium]|nr:hypothetical protein [bacterium]
YSCTDAGEFDRGSQGEVRKGLLLTSGEEKMVLVQSLWHRAPSPQALHAIANIQGDIFAKTKSAFAGYVHGRKFKFKFNVLF